jgi:hypothetical protein
LGTVALVTYILVMATLQSILKSLVELYNDPIVDEQTYYDAASYAREAGEIAMEFGIEPERVSEIIMPSAAIALVNSYILQLPVQSTESLTATAHAKALGCRRTTIMAPIRAGRIPAINISTSANPNYRFCLESVKSALAAKPVAKSTRKQAPTKPFLV